MEPLRSRVGTGVALRRSDVDTDQIIPAEYCKRLTKSGYADTLFSRWREDPTFVLNRPEHASAGILVAEHNFGTGSSREHAVWALRDWGFTAVIATSFGDIFLRNALKNGLLAIQLPPPAVAGLADRVEADPSLEITVDLEACEVGADGERHPFSIDHRARWLLLRGLDEIAVTLTKDEVIKRYERSRLPWLPSLVPTSHRREPGLRLGAAS